MGISFAVVPNGRYCELGGGETPMMKRGAGFEVVQVDLRVCQDENGNRIQDFAANFDEKLPIDSDSFDGTVSRFALEHCSWRSIKLFISEIYRITKPGGKILIITANFAAQAKRVLAVPEEEWGDEESRIIFGDQNYQGNYHSVSLSPGYATKLFSEAGFENILIAPFGEIATDMIIEANKPQLAQVKLVNKSEPVEQPKVESIHAQVKTKTLDFDNLTTQERERLYDRKYWEESNYQNKGFLWDFPHYEVVAHKVLEYRPESVLELGCGRGYVLKRLQDYGDIKANGMEISEHTWKTRACNGIIQRDILTLPWPWKDKEFDLVFSEDFWSHVPEKYIPELVKEMERVSNRGVHAISIAGKDYPKDVTRCTMKDLAFWRDKLPRTHTVVEKDEFESGSIPKKVLEGNGDGKVKWNLGAFCTQHRHGWINSDIMDVSQFAQANGYRFHKQDLRQGIPANTGTVDLFILNHFLEHLSYKEGLDLLRECRRCIKTNPPGAMRIIVPDGELLLSRYPIKDMNAFDEVNAECQVAPTMMKKLWSLLLENHKACYDGETLIHTLGEAGWIGKVTAFREVAPDFRTNENLKQILRETLDMHPAISLYVDAVPIVG